VIAGIEFAHVNPIVWCSSAMIYPMMIQIDFAAVRDVGKRSLSGAHCGLITGWISHSPWPHWACSFRLFVPVDLRRPTNTSPPILLGVAPQTAMVFV
jgi:ACR3 family arsenite transporter